MAEIDLIKLRNFVEAALTNPRHPVYQMGLTHSPILQHYAVNVMELATIPAERWFADYPQWTAKLAEVMRLCEEEAAAAQEQTDETTALKAELAALKAEVEKLKKPAPEADDDSSDSG